jgi:hypothetical protein
MNPFKIREDFSKLINDSDVIRNLFANILLLSIMKGLWNALNEIYLGSHLIGNEHSEIYSGI